ncbi:hypothetical protein T4E_12264 [Trichinella pseudospiralis]|uniref:DnaJ homologue subfamily C GRV2/DNAJC13 N-terminal domain-containing protein n=1 Tax=Trichinella pseudospiralis TaxID=6337 RepID=A0A0V0XTV6_TRIPS|nr:hypothetical protein T4E_12264 [Trichinella pseudospiralis]
MTGLYTSSANNRSSRIKEALLLVSTPFCSARNGGVSLNSLLNTDSNLITLLLGILVRFRCGRIAVKADVKGMFNQVAVTPADSDMLAFLWTSSVDRQPDELIRDTFSVLVCFPALANITLRETVKRKDMAIAQIVNEAFYMDDLYWSDDDEGVVINAIVDINTRELDPVDWVEVFQALRRLFASKIGFHAFTAVAKICGKQGNFIVSALKLQHSERS